MFPNSRGARKKAGQKLLDGILPSWTDEFVAIIKEKALEVQFLTNNDKELQWIIVFHPTHELIKAIERYNDAYDALKNKVPFGAVIIANLGPNKDALEKGDPAATQYPNEVCIRYAPKGTTKAQFIYQIYGSVDHEYEKMFIKLIKEMPNGELPLEQTPVDLG